MKLTLFQPNVLLIKLITLFSKGIVLVLETFVFSYPQVISFLVRPQPLLQFITFFGGKINSIQYTTLSKFCEQTTSFIILCALT